MNAPNFPIFKIVKNIIISVIVGIIIGFFIGLGLNLIGIFTDQKYDYTNINIISGLVIFSILTYFTISNHNEEVEKFEKKSSEELEERNKREKRKIEINENENNYYELLNNFKKQYADSGNKVFLLENDFHKLLYDKESTIIEIDNKENKSYTHQFIKISNYINKKRNHIQHIYDNIISDKIVKKIHISGVEKDFVTAKIPQKEYLTLPTQIEQFEKSIILYEQVIIHSINMISLLINNKLFTFYHIYEFFDSIGIYETNWQIKMTDKLDDINNTLKTIDKHLEDGLDNLTYCFENSFIEFGNTISKDLQTINSSIQFNNLITAIQTRKLYQIRSDTKRLN